MMLDLIFLKNVDYAIPHREVKKEEDNVHTTHYIDGFVECHVTSYTSVTAIQ